MLSCKIDTEEEAAQLSKARDYFKETLEQEKPMIGKVSRVAHRLLCNRPENVSHLLATGSLASKMQVTNQTSWKMKLALR